MSTYITPLNDEFAEGLGGESFTETGKWVANTSEQFLTQLENYHYNDDIAGELDEIGSMLHIIVNLLNELNENLCNKTRKK